MKATDVLNLFATYGFRKASMSDIAKAAELSRQSIYNQFGSKEAVLEWAVTAFLNEITDLAVQQLKTLDGQPSEILARSFRVWIGDHVPLLRGTPHGAEILDQAISSAANANRGYEDEFAEAVAAFLLEQQQVSTQDAAVEATFALNLASKGLLLKCDTTEAYSLGMQRVIRVIFHYT